jgi:predicted alpha/beta superfamily hydrolase
MKKLLSLILSAFLILSVIPAAAYSSGGYGNGDVNLDKNLSIKDASLIQRSIAKLTELDETQKKLADFNMDNFVNIKDATKIQKVIAEIDPMPEEPTAETQPATVETEAVTSETAPVTEPATAETATEPTSATEATAPNPEVSSKVNIYFTNNKKWSKVYFFLYNSKTGDGPKEWPGTQVTKSTTNTNGEKVFSSTVDVSKYNRIIFNDGANNQSVNVAVNRASSGFFIYENSQHTQKEKLVGTYAYKGADKGTLKELSFDYPEGYKKKVWIWTPADYDPDSKDPYKTVYMPDGQNIFDFKNVAWGGWEVSDAVESYMSNGGRGMILVGIESTGSKRDTELTPNLGEIQEGVGNQYKNGKGKVFSDFVVNTVMPYVRENYNSSKAKVDNIVAGSSSGGLEAFYIGMEHYDKFSAIGAFSPAFILFGDEVWNNYLSKFDLESEDMPKIYLYDGKVGLEDTLYPFIDDMNTRLSEGGYANDKLTFVLEEKAEHNEAWWRVVFPEFLDWGVIK